MPKYANANAYEVNIAQYRIPALGTLETLDFLQNLPAGVTKTADTPSYNPILLDSDYAPGTTTITVPVSPTNAYFIDIHANTGNSTAKYNTAAMSPVITVLEGETYRRQVVTRLVDTIILTVPVLGLAHVRIEQG